MSPHQEVEEEVVFFLGLGCEGEKPYKRAVLRYLLRQGKTFISDDVQVVPFLK